MRRRTKTAKPSELLDNPRFSAYLRWAGTLPAGWNPASVVRCRNGWLNADTLEFLGFDQIPDDPAVAPLARSQATWNGLDEPCPVFDQWLADILLDPNDQADLCAWLGYLLLPDRSMRQGLNLVGRPYSGKSTILRLIERLIGPESCETSNVMGLSRDYGLEGFDRRLVCTIPVLLDWFDRAAYRRASEKIRAIIGGAPVAIRAKGQSALPAGILPIRFVVCSYVPIVSWGPDAFEPRQWHTIRIPGSFAGRGDRGIEDRLAAELSGILAKCLHAYRDMKSRGRFLAAKGGAL